MPSKLTLPRRFAFGGCVLASAACLANSWHIWTLTGAATLTWRLGVLAFDSSAWAGYAVAFALAAFGSPRVRRFGWLLAVGILVVSTTWAILSLGGLLTAALPPLGVPEPPDDVTPEPPPLSRGSAHPPVSDAERERIGGALYYAHADRLCAFADRMLRQRGRRLRAITAQDLVHDAFTVLLDGKHDTILRADEADARRYLQGVIAHQVTDQSRAARRRATLDALQPDLLTSAPIPAPDLEYTMTELDARIQDVLATAPKGELAVYRAVREDDLSYAEAAVKLGMTTGTVGVLLSRIALRFRWALGDWPVPLLQRRARRRPTGPSAGHAERSETSPDV